MKLGKLILGLLFLSTTAHAARVHVERMGDGGGGGGGGGWSGGGEFHGSAGRSYSGSFPASHGVIMRNSAVVQSIRQSGRVEVVPRHYYRHDINGTRYWHYYDRDAHWYGFYHGRSFYWTRYYGDHWWWYDNQFGRWSFWWDGYWWWGAPGGAVYVYVNGDYYPYEPGLVPVDSPSVLAAPQDSPAATSPNGGGSVNGAPANTPTKYSPDGSRSVQVVNGDAEAFLYDTSSGRSVYMKHLGDQVEKVRFSGGKNGRPLKILVDFKDGHFSFFDGNGNELETTTTESTPAATAPAPAQSAPAPSEEAPPSPPPAM